jgi:hypothetical protein
VPGLLFLGCGRTGTVEATAPPRPATSVPAGPLSTFQGEVASVDEVAGEVVVDVQIVWVPLMKTEPHQRTVIVDSRTGWEPAPAGIGGLRVGDNVQVEAEDTGDSTWRAVKVQLFDVD